MHSLMSCSSHFQQCSQNEDMKLFGDLIVKVSQHVRNASSLELCDRRLIFKLNISFLKFVV